MCYTCSPSCDNCMPKMMKCPQCGELNMISYEKCCACGASFSEEVRDQARDDWTRGVRLGNGNATRSKRPLPPNSPPAANESKMSRRTVF